MTLTGTQQRIVEAAWDRLDEFGDEDRRAVSYAVSQLVVGRDPSAMKPDADLTVKTTDAAFLVDALQARLRKLGAVDTYGTLNS